MIRFDLGFYCQDLSDRDAAGDTEVLAGYFYLKYTSDNFRFCPITFYFYTSYAPALLIS
jgi:hypothetical protein